MRLVLGVWLCGCGGTTTDKESADSGTSGPTEAEIQQIWNDYLAKHQGCAVPEDCTVISPGCPLGCYAFVNVKSAEAAADLASSLISDYQEACGCGCDYGCAKTGDPTCVGGTCQAAPKAQ